MARGIGSTGRVDWGSSSARFGNGNLFVREIKSEEPLTDGNMCQRFPECERERNENYEPKGTPANGPVYKIYKIAPDSPTSWR